MENLPVYEDILLAEDDPDDVFFFSMALNNVLITAKLRHADNGDKLFEELKKNIPDLLFLDIQMPCRDGMDCIREIRQNKRYDSMPVILLTSLSHTEMVESSYRIGANFFIAKTAAINELADKIRRILSIDWKSNMVYPTLEQYVV
jgi:DNA-binding response OmpR family regulator